MQAGVVRTIVAGVLLLTAGLALAQSVICSSCGYENPMSNPKCFHCNHAMPAMGRPPSAADQKPKGSHKFLESGKLEAIGHDLVESEIERGLNLVREGEYNLGYFFLRNAAALELLADPSSGNERSLRINVLVKRCVELRGSRHRSCTVCNGTGKGTMTVRSTTGEVSERSVSTKACEACGGTGKVPHAGSVQERIYEMGQAKSRYDAVQRARKFVSAGEAWIPDDVASALTVKQSVVLKRATAAPCKECMGIGRTQCRRCNAKGRMACTNAECKKGKVTVTKRSSLSKSDLKQAVNCPVCKGAALLDCPLCEGKGSVLCQVCNGTGEREVCSRCDGRGMEDCRYCKGTGDSKGKPCTFCKADGAVECTACRGDGRK